MLNAIRKVKSKAANFKVAMTRARDWSTYFNFFMLLFVTISSLRQYESFKFLTTKYIIWIMIIGVFGMALFGWIDLHWGLYKLEVEKLNRINPIWVETFNRLERIENKLGNMENEFKRNI